MIKVLLIKAIPNSLKANNKKKKKPQKHIDKGNILQVCTTSNVKGIDWEQR
jgi:hypothetical protein